MKICPLCDLVFGDNFVFCTEDGSQLNNIDRGSAALADSPGGQASVAQASASNTVEEKSATGPVLYCPACGVEYPLTFSVCPVDNLPLANERTSFAPSTSVDADAAGSGAGNQGQNDSINIAQEQTISGDKPARATMTRSRSEQELNEGLGVRGRSRLRRARKIVLTPEVEDEILMRAEPNYWMDGRQRNSAASRFRRGQVNSGVATNADSADRPGFRLAATGIALSLAILALLTVYTFFANANRKPPAPSAQEATISQAENEQPSALIETPRAASEYSEPAEEEAPVAAAGFEDVDRPARAISPSRRDFADTEAEPRKQTQREPAPLDEQQVTRPRIAAAPVTKASHEQDLPPARADGRIEADLARVQGRRTATGYRYDLTFTLREMAVRSLEWERISISTRSISGLSSSDSLPFHHRLGRAGLLTFTISVEMRGATEADWKGRIFLIAFGYDDAGRVVRTSFGANVSP